MKSILRFGLPTLLVTLFLSTTLYAQDGTESAGSSTQMTPPPSETNANSSGGNPSDDNSTVSQYLATLGDYLGYDITQTVSFTPFSQLLNLNLTQAVETLLLQTSFGAIPMTSGVLFGPTNSTVNNMNTQANTIFQSSYSSPSQAASSATQSGNSITVVKGIDQQTYQQDPVSQSLMNMLTTPDYSYCMNYLGTLWTGGNSSDEATSFPTCKYTFQYLVESNVLGNNLQQNNNLPPPPSATTGTSPYFSTEYNAPFLSELNINSLIGPLLYANETSSNTNNYSSSNYVSSTGGIGLPNQNPAQVAADYIRYATGSVTPLSLPQQKDYSDLYNQATSPTSTLEKKMQAQGIILNYFTRLRTYVSQVSVAYSNLYYILSKRMPQNSSSQTSEALNEYNMATWRLFNANGTSNNGSNTLGGASNTNPSSPGSSTGGTGGSCGTWLCQINTASEATVQKEMAVLLAEINYQLYLTRQQQERLLLTNTMLLLMNSRTAQPSPPSLHSSKTSNALR